MKTKDVAKDAKTTASTASDPLCGVIFSSYNGAAPAFYTFRLGMPNETMEQLAARMQLEADRAAKSNGQGYEYSVMLGSLTHELEPLPPPPPVPVRKIQALGPQFTGRLAAAAKRTR